MSRHVDAGEGRQHAQQDVAVATVPREHGVGDRADRLLAVAEEDGVEEGCERLGIEGARSPGDDERVAGTARRCAQRYAAQLEHGQQVGVRQLVLQAEADHVEVAQRECALQRDERQAAGAQQGLEIGPGRVDALRGDVLPAIQDVVQDLQPEVGLGDLVDLGEGEREAERCGVEVLSHGPALVAEVAPRLLDQRKNALDLAMIRPEHGGVRV